MRPWVHSGYISEILAAYTDPLNRYVVTKVSTAVYTDRKRPGAQLADANDLPPLKKARFGSPRKSNGETR